MFVVSYVFLAYHNPAQFISLDTCPNFGGHILYRSDKVIVKLNKLDRLEEKIDKLGKLDEKVDTLSVKVDKLDKLEEKIDKLDVKVGKLLETR